MAFVLGLCAPRSVLAQVDVGGFFGFYSPLGAMVQKGSTSDLNTYSQKRLEGAITVGGDAVLWTSNRIGLAGTIGYVPSQVAVTDSTGTRDEVGSLLLLSARALLAFTPMTIRKHEPGGRRADWSYYAGAGAGLAIRSGTVWSYYSGLTSPAAVVSLGVRSPLATRTVMRMEVTDYFSRAHFDKGLPTETAARWHNDVVLSLVFLFRAIR